MGYATEEQVKSFLDHVVDVERAMIASGIILIKYWLEVEPDEQTRRLQDRIDDGRKVWKLSPMDLESYGRWYDYSRARDKCSPSRTRRKHPGTLSIPTKSAEVG